MNIRSTPTMPKDSNHPQKEWLWIVCILGLATVLGFYKLGSESLWIDELYSIYSTKLLELTPLAILQRFAQVRPVYYYFLKAWMVFSTDEAWLRSLSVLFGTGSVFLTYYLGRKIAGMAVGLLAALMLALAPMFIYYSQMVRMYAPGILFGLLGSLFLVFALEQPKAKYFLGWAIARSIVFLTVPLNVTLLLPDLIFLGLTFRKQPQVLKGLWKWLLLITLLCLPSATYLFSEALPFLKKALGLKEDVAAAAKQADSNFNLFLDLFRKIKKFTVFPFPSTSKTMGRILQSYTLVLLSVAGIAFYKNRSASRLVWVAGWAFIPWFVHGAVSESMLFDRYVVYTIPYLLILLAAGIVRVWHMHRVVAMGIVIPYAILVTMGLGRYYGVQDRQDWRSLFEFVNQNEQPGDTIIYSMELVNPDRFSNALKYYHQGDASMIHVRELCERPKITTPEALNKLQKATASLKQIWLLCGSRFEKDEFQTALEDYGQLDGHWQFVNQAFYRQEDYMNLFKVTLKP